MTRCMITHSLLSSWLYAIADDPYEDAETGRDRYAEFLDVLNRVRREPTQAMLDGINFESMVTDIAEDARTDPEHRWFGAAEKIAGVVRGGQFQCKAKKTVIVAGQPFLLYGRLDVLKAGTIYDIKFSRSYDRGKYFSSTQHPMYMELIPEAQEFTYLISNGSEVWSETYSRGETRSIFPVIADFTGWLRAQGLFPVYAEKWAAR